MKDLDLDLEDARLRELLRKSLPVPPLPPRFQEGVWQRIERGQPLASRPERETLLELVAGWMLRPRLALASVAVLLLAGLLLGALSGVALARQDAQSRYLAAVAPNALR